MKHIGKLVYKNAWEYEVYVVVMRDKNSMRVSVDIYIISPDGKMSDLMSIPRKDIYTKKNCFDFFYDLDGDFQRDDIDKIKMGVLNCLKEDKDVEIIQSKATPEELHTAVSRYIKENAEELKDNLSAEIFVKDDYGYMYTSCMDEFVKLHKELGYKRLDILKRLKVMGVLKNGNNRPYDIQVSIGGEKRRFYKIELAVEDKEDTDDEVISV